MILKGIDIFKNQPVRISVEKGTIVDKQPIPHEANLPFVSPGFFDVQVNGYQGLDYSSAGLTVADVAQMVRNLAPSGTTRHVPTIITNSQERICQNLETIARAVREQALVAAAIPGIHIEGPYISAEDGPRGAHDRSFVRDPSIAELDEWIEASHNLLRVVTLAPERDKAIPFISYAVSKGIVVSIGHTGATPEQIREAVDAGATLSTHLGNGSHAMLPRLKNYLWEQLADEHTWAGIIADGYHLPDSVLKVFAKAKGLDRIVLVSDVAFLGGYDPGRYNWGNIAVEVYPDGHLGLADTPFLAGAGHLLDTCIPRFAAAAGIPLAQSVALATSNPERLLGLGEGKQAIRVGSRADLVLFTVTGPNVALNIERTVLAGATLYERKEAWA
ncbi:MAG: N-acetylglucosamine-6-phosphate deacetylase [Sphaerochaetaceae bacterium]